MGQNKQTKLEFKKLTCLKKRIQSSQIEKRATADQPRIHNVIFNKISNHIFRQHAASIYGFVRKLRQKKNVGHFGFWAFLLIL